MDENFFEYDDEFSDEDEEPDEEMIRENTYITIQNICVYIQEFLRNNFLNIGENINVVTMYDFMELYGLL